MCACVPEVQFAGTSRDKRGDETKGRSMGFSGREVCNMLICQRSWMLVCVPKVNPPVSRGGVDDD
jgi:hypothetical protein